MPTWRQRIGAYLSKAFQLGPAVVEAVDVAFGNDPEQWSPTVYGNYLATSSAVYACVNLRARNIASLPLTLTRSGKVVEQGAIHDLLSTVNPHWTPNRLWQMTVMALDLWGEAFWVLERGQDGQQRPREIWWARPDRMRLVPDPDNYVKGWIYEWNGQRLAFTPGEVIWFRHPNPLDEFAGLSPIAATRLALDTGHAALRSNHNVFSNGVQLAGVVSPADKDSTWTRDQVEALRDLLDRRFRGVDKAHRLAVLGQAATFTPMSISPKDAQFIELMKWTRTDACMVYGVPPELIGDQDGSTYNNVQQAHTGFWTDTLIPLASMLAGELTEQLLPMFGTEADACAFDLSNVAALQTDAQKLAEQAKVWASIGVPLNAILRELAPQFLDSGNPWPWGDQPIVTTQPPDAPSATKALGKGIIYGSQAHKAAYEAFGRRADRVMASMLREVTRLLTEQGQALAEALAVQAAKAFDNEADVDAIWNEEAWQTIFADALLGQIQLAAELGAVATLGDLGVSTALFNLDSPEVAAAMVARSQAFAEPVNATTWETLKGSLLEGIQAGEGIAQLQERVNAVMADRIRSSAETIARTETIGALTDGSLMGAKGAADTGLDVRKQWLATFDGRERDSHAAAHRRYQANAIALEQPFDVGGVAFDSPANPTGGRTRASAAECINCRCAMTYEVRDDNQRGAVITSNAVADITGWLNAAR